MNKSKMILAGIDISDGIKRFDGNIQLYEKFLYGFLIDPNYKLMMEAVDQGDTSSAFQAAHALKGIAGNLSLTELYKNIVPLVDLFRSNTMENASELLLPVKNSYSSILDALND